MKILIIVSILTLMYVANIQAGCDYECGSYCKLIITSEINYAVGPHGRIYVPRCKPCGEVCRYDDANNGFSGGKEWLA